MCEHRQDPDSAPDAGSAHSLREMVDAELERAECSLRATKVFDHPERAREVVVEIGDDNAISFYPDSFTVGDRAALIEFARDLADAERKPKD